MPRTERTIYTCDRCGTEIPWLEKFSFERRRTVVNLRWWTVSWSGYRDAYLCPTCKEAFDKFMDGEKVRDETT